MELSNLVRFSTMLRHPSCEDEQQTDVLEKQLNQFWGQDSKDLGLEGHFQADDFLTALVAPKIVPTTRKAIVRHDAECVIRGEDIGDIPTNYVISGLKSSEIPVIGTYVDHRIVPGFRYRIRLNQSEKYLFGATPLYLEAVGSGYGKRLVFQGTSKNQNENYFWSDSQPNGYGFKPIALWDGDQVTLTKEVAGGNDVIQEVRVVSCVSQTEVDMKISDQGEVEKRFQVKFLCRPVDQPEDGERVSLVVAVAVLSKAKNQRRSKVKSLLLATRCSVRASSFARNQSN